MWVTWQGQRVDEVAEWFDHGKGGWRGGRVKVWPGEGTSLG